MTRRAYDTVAATYAEVLSDTSFEASEDLAMVQQFVDAIEKRPARILDAGCGAGRMIPYLQSLSNELHVTGSDLSPAMITIARVTNPNSEFVVADSAALPFEADQFDGLLAWYSIIHTSPEGLDAVFAEFARVLRPGGLLLLGFQSGQGVRRISQAYGLDVELDAVLHETADVFDRLGGAGFAVETVLDRTPRALEKHPQGFVLAVRKSVAE